MKKITLIAFVLFIGLVKSQAQVKVSPGLRGGLNISTLTNIDDNSSKTDFYIGGLVDIKFNRYFSLQPEITYSRQGDEGRYFENGRYYSEKYELNYLTLGAVAKYHFGGKGFHVLAGPSLDIKVGDNYINTNPEGFDLAIVGGVGYTLPNGLTFEARIKQGLIDIYGYDGLDNNNDDYYYNDVILNQVFQIGISYTFKVK
ncbi:Outer membrane protein beta-barrel domain-containing protein [Flavobacterium sp. CF108]|uniref:porin family protein n=1 Tax=unclassified Flavobacterium TaxID=196869 RepID=UPI0008AF9D79|nr:MULTISPECIES: porin family protein [unclassified Flavobacterium]SEN66120.1 Outer membrane protein beta-barrel domain-containing protein [Flavobacterium sp. fv08]SHH06740.1 Outer membrane protein beta-barrel domain-containing protein [Flavobacterium sp. CF108]